MGHGKKTKYRFSRIFKVAFVRLGYGNVNDCPAGLGNWSAMLEIPAGARNRRKATSKYDDLLLRFLSMIQNKYLVHSEISLKSKTLIIVSYRYYEDQLKSKSYFGIRIPEVEGDGG